MSMENEKNKKKFLIHEYGKPKKPIKNNYPITIHEYGKQNTKHEHN